MANSVASLRPNYARVHDADGKQGAKEYVPVDAAHERAIAEGRASAENGVQTSGAFGFGSRRRVRFNCSYEVMDAQGAISVRRAGHERVYDPRKEKMDDRACEGMQWRPPTFEEEALAMGPRGGRAYPRFLGWGAFPANRLGPELPRTFGVRVPGGR